MHETPASVECSTFAGKLRERKIRIQLDRLVSYYLLIRSFRAVLSWTSCTRREQRLKRKQHLSFFLFFF